MLFQFIIKYEGIFYILPHITDIRTVIFSKLKGKI